MPPASQAGPAGQVSSGGCGAEQQRRQWLGALEDPMIVFRKALCAGAVAAALTLAGCAGQTSGDARPISAAAGEIVTAEKIAGVNQSGGNAAIRVGSALLGVLVRGPWGGVAGTAGGEAGKIALSEAGDTVRYVVRREDGSLVEIEQSNGAPLSPGATVQLIEMSDGTVRIAPT